MPISAAQAKPRAKIAALTRAVRNGERPADCPELKQARRDLAYASILDDAEKLAARATQLVKDWPELSEEQLGRIANVIKVASRGTAS